MSPHRARRSCARLLAPALITLLSACSDVLTYDEVEFADPDGGAAGASADGAVAGDAQGGGPGDAKDDGAKADASALDGEVADAETFDQSTQDAAEPPVDASAPDTPAPACGDGDCNGAETCGDCPGDCGACPPVCGDGKCEAGETCSACAADCKVTACPSAPAGFGTGDGLKPIDVCAFPMSDTKTWDSRGAVIAQLAAVLPVRTVSDVLGDLNRQGTSVSSVPGLSSVHRGIKWEQGDVDVSYWIPQGITGSGDAVAGTIGGKNVLVVSWYYDDTAPNKGVRLAIMDAASRAYRLLLLVDPYMNGARPDFKAIPIHAGGLAWFKDLLYVADTSNGFRVFDMSRILQVTTGVDDLGWDSAASVYRAYNYKYVVPQIGAYKQVSSCAPRFSFTALDRATSPPSLVSGEYIDADPKGRLYRWALDPSTGRLAGGDLFVPTEAFYSGQKNIQGAVPAYGRWLLSSSAPAGGAGALYRVAAGFSSTHAWSDSPEDLTIDVATGELWGLSEAAGARFVYSKLASAYQ